MWSPMTLTAAVGSFGEVMLLTAPPCYSSCWTFSLQCLCPNSEVGAPPSTQPASHFLVFVSNKDSLIHFYLCSAFFWPLLFFLFYPNSKANIDLPSGSRTVMSGLVAANRLAVKNKYHRWGQLTFGIFHYTHNYPSSICQTRCCVNAASIVLVIIQYTQHRAIHVMVVVSIPCQA